jgi:hypothetical protein
MGRYDMGPGVCAGGLGSDDHYFPGGKVTYGRKLRASRGKVF